MSKESEPIQTDDNYINLQKFGRIFPTWVLANFKKYKLPQIFLDDNKDPCNVKKTKFELRKYQQFLGSYLDYNSPYRNMLIYHGLGSGKTATAINIYNMLFNYNPNWNVFIIIPARLKNNPWVTDLEMWIADKNKKDRLKNIIFIHYDSPYADKDFLNAIKAADSSKKSLYIFDEAHNFIKNVYNNMISKQGRRALIIYDYIYNDIKDNEGSRVILLSGTPAVNDVFELSIIFNLLRPQIFPLSYNKFTDMYVSNNKLIPEKKNMFQRRILGLISYYLGATPDLFAKKVFHYKNLVMSNHQLDVYKHYEEIERKIEQKAAVNRTKSNIYRSYTRQSSNFVFPNLKNKIKGENRPRPGHFSLTEQEIEKLLDKYQFEEDRKKARKSATITAFKEYSLLTKQFIDALKNHFKKTIELDKKKGLSIKKDMKIFLSKYNGKFFEFWKDYRQKSNILIELYKCSCKMTAILFYILRSKGPVIIYSNYVKMEGIEIMRIYLETIGYSDFFGSKGYDNLRFIEYSGSITKKQREKGRLIYNNKNNIYGKIIKIILISPAGSEGISLLNVRQVHVLEPYWNEVRIQQLVGRAIRACSHKALPIKERYVDIYRYKAIRQKGKTTTDQQMEELALNKLTLVESFLKTMREAAVDCKLFQNHNNLIEDVKCFDFNIDDITAKYVGPAYIMDEDQDQKIDGGLNAENSEVKNIDVYQVTAVNSLSKDKFSKPIYYWYNIKRRLLFDFDLYYPIAKVALDDFGIPKIHKSSYIITNFMNIPKLKNIN